MRTILVAADFSERSREAFGVACSLVSATQTRVIVFHVVEPRLVPESPVYLGQQTVQFTAVPRDRAEYDRLKNELRAAYVPDRALDVEYQTSEGEAAPEILRFAEETGCDLIVMGTHGRTGLERLLMGSVAEAVLRRACCPVLVVKTPAHARGTTAARHWEGSRAPAESHSVTDPAL
jgi:nucleotide-binding universal stress UspA family protein